MKTLAELSAQLEAQRRRLGLDYKTLADDTGLTPLAVRHALQGKAAARITTLMALASRLGLELVLVPPVFAASLPSGNLAQWSAGQEPPPIPTSVDLAIAQARAPRGASKP